MKEIIKDYQLLIGLIIIALVIYQFTGSDLDTCVDAYMDRYTKNQAIEECLQMIY